MEDDLDLIELYTEAFAMQGYHIDGATTLDQARNLLKQHPYKIFLADMHIGEERGTTLLKEIMDSDLSLQIVRLSGTGQYQAEATAMGVDFFLVKPVEIPELIALIDRLSRIPL